jgi:serine/threonine-protein kinase
VGAYGAVYRALHAQSPSGPVALKLALHPDDARFARERELLSRLHHPHVPRLLDHGLWQLEHLGFPFLVMDLVDGVSLYDWARRHRPSSRQVLLLLSRLASALDATHSARGLHRDVKGSNVLVREADGWPFLADFGSGHFLGASTLTWHPLPPGTPPYRSPEAWRSVQPPFHESALPYAPAAADDVFALGITAYRLVTGEYPAGEDPAALLERWERLGPPSARALNARCCGELSALTSRMLSLQPEARGSARKLAEALEQAAREAGSEADAPLFDKAPEPASAKPASGSPRSPAPPGDRSRNTRLVEFIHTVRSRFTAASLGAALALGAAWMFSTHPGVENAQRHASTPEEAEDGGTVAVGDTALTAPVPLSQAPFAESTISVDLPPRPLPGQQRPDANGRCPSKAQVSIHGGCWYKVTVDLKDCEGEGCFIYKSGCYAPALAPSRPPTSSPMERPGGTAK